MPCRRHVRETGAARPTRRAVSMINPASSKRLDAIQTRNARRAVALMQAHIEASRSRFIANYNSPRKQRAPTRDRELRNPPNLMVVRHYDLEVERIEQLALFTLVLPHHRNSPSM